MADARITQTGVESLTTGSSPVRVSHLSAEVLSQTAVPIRMSQTLAEVLSRLSEPVPLPVIQQRRIRRLRQSPHLSDEQAWLFLSSFQLDLETGRGLTSGQGIDPQIMCQWSDDGGHTWSEESWVSAGVQGAYQWRAIWRRLGKSRDRVWRVVVSDPVPWRFLSAWINVEKGTA